MRFSHLQLDVLPSAILFLLALVFPVYESCWMGIGLGMPKARPHEMANNSDIVVVGRVKNKFWPYKASSKYAINFEVERVIKGRSIMDQLPSSTPVSLLSKSSQDSGFDFESAKKSPEKNVYPIYNFGPYRECYADVTEDKWYILYLRVVNDHLSAHYDRPHAAAQEYSQEVEEKILAKLYGWRPWSEWSGCSKSCGKGAQTRTRECRMEAGMERCEGSSANMRHCNMFECRSGIKDLVQMANFERKPIGVIEQNAQGSDRARYYDITENFYGQISGRKMFRESHWPANYSIIARLRPRQTKFPRQAQYLLSLSDASGKQYFGIRLFGNTENTNPIVEFLFEDGNVHGMQFPFGHSSIGLNNGQWHQISFRVSGNRVEAFSDCQSIGSLQFPPSDGQPKRARVSRSSLIIASQMYKMQLDAPERFEGSIAQLVLTDTDQDAALQCSGQVHDISEPQQENGLIPRKSKSQPCVNGDDEDCLEEGSGMAMTYWEWTAWSKCSVSCGGGVRVRKPVCKEDDVEPEDCIPHYVPAVLEKKCNEYECPKCGCKNGGDCRLDGECSCPAGWTGAKCQHAICKQRCDHGDCIRPGQCSCDRGWSGPRCSTPTCQPGCENGGLCVSPNSCQCPPGFGGQYCNQKLTYCVFRCQNGGKCVGHNKCECPEGYSGRYCHHKEPVCEKSCLNGGRCMGGRRCRCPKGYTGRTCEIDSCGQCQNGGVCNRYTRSCECPTLVTGPLCQHRILSKASCEDHPCQNNGRCIGDNRCHCTEGWFGRDCKLKRCKDYAFKSIPSTYKVSKPVYRYFPCSVHTASNQHSILCRKFIGYKTESKAYQKKVPDYQKCAE